MTREEALHLLDTVPGTEVRRGSLMLRARDGRREYAFMALPWRAVPVGGLAAMDGGDYEVCSRPAQQQTAREIVTALHEEAKRLRGPQFAMGDEADGLEYAMDFVAKAFTTGVEHG